MSIAYKRILLKLSGEVLAGAKGTGIDNDTVVTICKSVKKISDMGVETAMNSLALCDALEQLGADVRVQTAIEMRQIAEPYIRNKAIRHFEKGRIVIFGCGTGSPFFSTDTAAALRAVEINADVLLEATNVDGVYDKDPNKYDDAVKFDNVTFKEVLARDIKVMDSTAFSLCKDNDLSILVFDLTDPENIVKAVSGETIGTLVEN